MIAGGQHYMTFDGRYYEFSGECTYLLAQDFVRQQFAVLIKYVVDGDKLNHQIIVLIGGKAIQLDVFNNVSTSANSTHYRSRYFFAYLKLTIHFGNALTLIITN